MFGVKGDVLVLVLLCFISIKSEEGFFYGGSISYKIEQIAGKKIAHVELITGWVLGKGPCGSKCSKNDINTMTNSKRLQKEDSTGNQMYFGNFSTDYTINKVTTERDLNAIVRANYSEWVIAVNEQAKWEQELIRFSFEMAEAAEDISYLYEAKQACNCGFDGNFWRPLLNGNTTHYDIPWHFQTKMVQSLRSDTKRMNSCPQVLTKAFYRVKLNKITTIQIPMIDPDGDVVRCSLAAFVEAGDLQPSPGIEVHNKSETSLCKVSINADSSYGYKDDTWIALPITFRDYNTRHIQFGDEEYIAGLYSLSASSAQFVVNILDNLVTPTFVSPTVMGDHMFIVYAGSTWAVDIYARSPINTTIEEFIPSGRSRESVTLSGIKDDPLRELVRFTTMSWTPSIEENGQHILCISAVDNTGVDTDEFRCFTIEVRADTFNHTSSTSTGQGKPYFFDIPSLDQFVNCKVGATCLIPVFVRSTAMIRTMQVTDSYTDEAAIGKVTQQEERVYKAILSFTHSMPGVEKICLSATDINNLTSEKVCFSSAIEPLDPCLSAPCRNSASCRSDKRTGMFVCECLSNKYQGTFCERLPRPCDPDPCTVGQSSQCFVVPPDRYYCKCKRGFTGNRCETNVYDCKQDSCNATTGSCRDIVDGFKCDCYQRYSGTNCTSDKCQGQSTDVLSCPAAGCSPNTCSYHGVCSDGGVCTCRIGYASDQNCSQSVDKFPGVTTIEFVPPTPRDKSRYTCFIASNEIKPCSLSVFVATSSSQKPRLSIESTSELQPNTSLVKVEASRVLPGINNVFSADIVIRGMVKQLNRHYICVEAYESSSEVDLCLELVFVQEPPLNQLQNQAAIKFVEPTQLESSILVGIFHETYTLVLYTTYSSNCENVISTSEGVTVFPTMFDGYGKCVTEASFEFPLVGIFDICFQSAKTNFQKRCFTAEGLPFGSDPCSGSPCQNEGHCFPDGASGFRCICQENYQGEKCQKGPCPSNGCQNDAYCNINDGQETCVCKAGFTGQNCELKSSDRKSEMSFTGTAKPSKFQCVIYQPCSVALLLTGNKQSGQKPEVSTGYVSPDILLNKIDVIDKGLSGGIQLHIGLKAKEVGLKDVCIQTIDYNGINKDELCIKVEVITDISTIYGFMDRPHFIYPSLPNNAAVECPESEPCHVIYQITPGEGYDKQCVSVAPFENSDFENYHIFKSCDPCTPGQSTTGNCSVDISLITSALDIGKVKRFCVAVSLVGYDMSGEERCFDLTVISKIKNNETKGCQMLQCKNGGFCDGHVPNKPKCFCKNGFSGKECVDQAGGKPPAAGSHPQTFIGDLNIPFEIRCKVDQTCSIQYQIVAATGEYPVISVGSSDPRLFTGEPNTALSGSSNIYLGYVNVHPSQIGTFHVCLQTNRNRYVHCREEGGNVSNVFTGLFKFCQCTTVEEICVTVYVSDATLDYTDLSKPNFVNPTLPKDSTVICQENRSCHFDLHFTNGDEFGFAGKCPSLRETGTNPLNEVHIFTPVYQPKSCNSDVMYTFDSSVTQTACFQIAVPGKKGEKRCYTIRTVSNITKEVTSPCTGISCENGGKCITDLTSSPAKSSCVCAGGYSGDDCEIAIIKTSNLPGVKNISRTTGISQHFDSNSGVPKSIKCDQKNPCCVVIPYHGDVAKPPLLGFKDTALKVTQIQLVTPDISRPDLHYFETCITGRPGEKHRMCFQTTTNGTKQGMNVDEICFEAEFENGGQDHISTEPKFTNTLSNGSSVSCQPKTICHVPVETNQRGGVCEQVKECGEGVPNTHVFKTLKVDNKCFTDVAIKTSEQEKQDTVCILAGSGGEQREIVIVTEMTGEFGPCQKMHCLNGGFCNSTTSASAVCECAAGFTGELCENDILTTSTTIKTSSVSTSTKTTVRTTSSGSTLHSEFSKKPSSIQSKVSVSSSVTSASAHVSSELPSSAPTTSSVRADVSSKAATVASTSASVSSESQYLAHTTLSVRAVDSSTAGKVTSASEPVSTEKPSSPPTASSVRADDSSTAASVTSASASVSPERQSSATIIFSVPAVDSSTEVTLTPASASVSSESQSSAPTTLSVREVDSSTAAKVTSASQPISTEGQSSPPTASSGRADDSSTAASVTSASASVSPERQSSATIIFSVPAVDSSTEVTLTPGSASVSSESQSSAPTTLSVRAVDSSTAAKVTSASQPISTEGQSLAPATSSVKAVFSSSAATVTSASKSVSSEMPSTAPIASPVQAVVSSIANFPSYQNSEVVKIATSTASSNTKTTLIAKTGEKTNTTEHCDNKKAKEHAETMVKTGYASCFCIVRGKKVYIIKKRPVVQKKDMFKAAGYGAGGMAGTLVIGIAVYAMVKKLRQPARSRLPQPSSKSRVHPKCAPTRIPKRTHLDF